MDRTKKIRLMTAGILVFFSVVMIAGYGARKDNGKWSWQQRSCVAVIHVNGLIVGGDDEKFSLKSPSSSVSGTLMKQFRKARQDEQVKAVLLRIDSPGGSAAATQEAAAELRKLKEAGKPVVVSMGDTAASGAYWLAAYGNKIYANPATITGSIGVYMSYYDLQGLGQKLGVSEQKIKSGAHKDIFSPFRSMTEEERQITQTMVDTMYHQFVSVVAKERHMDEEKVKSLADGRVFTGEQAQKEGLVDEMGNYYDALAYAGMLIGEDPDDVSVVVYDTADPFSQLLKGNISFGSLWQIASEARETIPRPLLLMRGAWQE